MGKRWSSPAADQQAPNAHPAEQNPVFSHEATTPPPRHAPSPSSSSITRATALSRARLKRRRRRATARGWPGVKRVIMVNGAPAGAEKTVAAQLGSQLVGEPVLLYWPHISAWVKCKVLKYGGETGPTKEMHLVRYTDGLSEWKELQHFCIVLAASHSARVARALKKRGGDKAGVESCEA